MTNADPPPEDVLERLRQRLVVLEAVVSALEQIDTVNAVVDQCDDRADAVRALAGLGYNDVQANAILDLTVGRRTATSRRQLADEMRFAREFLNRHDKE